jgi:hypothetical protein
MPEVSSPTQRTLKYLRENGWTACVVERWIERAKKRVDAFGFGDILAFSSDPYSNQIVLVQTTSATNHAAHRQKILAEPLALGWLRAGGDILLVSWRKSKVKRGGKAMLWKPRFEWFAPEDFDA